MQSIGFRRFFCVYYVLLTEATDCQILLSSPVFPAFFKQNKSYCYNHEVPDSKKAELSYKEAGHTDNYTLLEVELKTGRHHQIRCQLASIGCPIKGDLKYGARRSNPDGSISLVSANITFVHPVSKQLMSFDAILPDEPLWRGIVRNA